MVTVSPEELALLLEAVEAFLDAVAVLELVDVVFVYRESEVSMLVMTTSLVVLSHIGWTVKKLRVFFL